MTDINRELTKIVLESDVKTLKDISDMLVQMDTFRSLPGILNSIANDISDAIRQSEESFQ